MMTSLNSKGFRGNRVKLWWSFTQDLISFEFFWQPIVVGSSNYPMKIVEVCINWLVQMSKNNYKKEDMFVSRNYNLQYDEK